MAQHRLPATLPAAPVARKQHKAAVAAEREAQRAVDDLAQALKDAREVLKVRRGERCRAEDDLDAVEANER